MGGLGGEKIRVDGLQIHLFPAGGLQLAFPLADDRWFQVSEANKNNRNSVA